MEEREQPTMEPANVLNETEEKSAVSEVGSQQQADLGKFKSVEDLMDAYNSLQSEFTKKCQLLSQTLKDKTENEGQEGQTFNESSFNQFLEENDKAKNYADEIKNLVSEKGSASFEDAWGRAILNHLNNDKNNSSDPLINQYVLSNEELKNKVIEDYLERLKGANSPYIMSSSGGERLSSVLPDNPTSLEEAKVLTRKMFE